MIASKINNPNLQRQQYKYFPVLVALATTCMIISIILPYKIIKIGDFIMPGGVFVFPLFYFFGDIVVEVYGYNMAKQLIWTATFCLILYSIAVALIIRAPSPSFWHLQSAYDKVLGSSMRVLCGFIIGMLVSNFYNVYAVSRWKILLKGKFFWIRIIGGSSIGEIIFSIITGAIIYTGVISLKEYIHLTVSVWLFKLIYGIFTAYPATIIVDFLKKTEGVDSYDSNTDFNPFKLSSE